MKLTNYTKHNTSGLRAMLYDLAAKAHVSTRGVTVEIRRGTRYLHGIAYPYSRKIILYLLAKSKTQDIGFLWLHELTHLTKRNRKLYALGHGRKAQAQAEMVATKVLGVNQDEIKWHNNAWHTRQHPAFQTNKSALNAAREYRQKYTAWHWRVARVKSDREYPYRLQWKYNSSKL